MACKDQKMDVSGNALYKDTGFKEYQKYEWDN